MHKLMIKRHNTTGLKYLCYTQKEGIEFENYNGSGKYWVKHLKKHGNNISTEVIFETADYEQFRKTAIKYSHEFDVVASKDWANQRPEEGTGGNTVSGKMWITDGEKSKYHSKIEPIPTGWRKGRTGCVFNDSAKQAEFSNRADKTKASKTRSDSGWEGYWKGKKNAAITGDNNPAKRVDVKKKLSEAALNDRENRSERMKERWRKHHGKG